VGTLNNKLGQENVRFWVLRGCTVIPPTVSLQTEFLLKTEYVSFSAMDIGHGPKLGEDMDTETFFKKVTEIKIQSFLTSSRKGSGTNISRRSRGNCMTISHKSGGKPSIFVMSLI